MKDLAELIVRSLVDKPEGVNITETEGENVLILEVRVDQEDVGKVIGKEGRIANAMRTIVKAAAIKQGKRVTLEILTGDDNR
ncbi:MAG: KH domain-containing protein [Candidatus Margulisiibacteriota bacterium]|jgi:hypothetical protein